MMHLDDDQLLLHVYGELREAEGAEARRHLEACATCRERFRALAEPAAALEWAPPRRPHRAAWVALPLAAAIGALVLWPRAPGTPERPSWQSHSLASPVGGYVTGPAVMAIDSQLVRLERGRLYGTRLD